MKVRYCSVALALIATIVVVNGEARATAGPRVWFVDNSAARSGDGSIDGPLVTLVEAEDQSAPGDWIFVRTGDGSSRGLDTGIRLKHNQTLLGEGTGLDRGEDSVAPGAAPIITNPDGPGVVLASGCEVAGIDIVSTRGAGIVGIEVRELRLRDLKIASTGGPGVDLRNAGGHISLQRLEIDGTAGDGLSLALSVDLQNTGFEVVDCRLANIGRDGVVGRISGAANADFTIDGCEFERVAGTAAALTVKDRAAVRFRMERSRILGAGMGVGLTLLGSGRLEYHIVDNPEFSGIESTIVNAFVDPDSTSEARVSGEIARNSKMSKKSGSGFGIRLSCNGSGKVTTVVRDNRITSGVDADYGILAEARLGTVELNLEVVGNEVVVGADALEAVMVRSRDEARLCARIVDNRGSGGQVGLRVQQRGDSVFALHDLAADGIDAASVMNRLTSANPGFPSVAATADASFSGTGEGCAIPKEMTL